MMRNLLPSLLVALLLAAPAWAASPEFVEGVHYKLVRTPEDLPNARKVEVDEFFWYGCPHCYQFEANITPWLARKPEEVSFRRIPHTMGRSNGEMHALAYQMAEQLGIVKRIHAPMFKAIHDRKQKMDSVADICELFLKSGGIKEEPCRAAAENEEVQDALEHDEFLIQRYAIVSVPTLVVDGRYYSNAVMAGGMGKLMEVTKFLIAKQTLARNLQHDVPVDEPPLVSGPRNRAGAPSPF